MLLVFSLRKGARECCLSISYTGVLQGKKIAKCLMTISGYGNHAPSVVVIFRSFREQLFLRTEVMNIHFVKSLWLTCFCLVLC